MTSPFLLTPLLLLGSNILMTFAWYPGMGSCSSQAGRFGLRC